MTTRGSEQSAAQPQSLQPAPKQKRNREAVSSFACAIPHRAVAQACPELAEGPALFSDLRLFQSRSKAVAQVCGFGRPEAFPSLQQSVDKRGSCSQKIHNSREKSTNLRLTIVAPLSEKRPAAETKRGCRLAGTSPLQIDMRRKGQPHFAFFPLTPFRHASILRTQIRGIVEAPGGPGRDLRLVRAHPTQTGPGFN